MTGSVTPTLDPCQAWPLVGCDLSTYSTDPAVTGVAALAATEVLDALTAYRFAPCPVTIRPCATDCADGAWFGAPYPWWNWGSWPRPLFFQGYWYNLTCGSCVGNCSCQYISEAKLPTPVFGVTQVKVDGAVLAPATYALRDFRYLMRVDGQRWPRCNNLALADDQVGTWSVTLQVGEPVPTLGMLAVGELACQFAAILTKADCKLPKAVQSLVRQGVTLNFLDPSEVFPGGRVGLYTCDLFIQTYNPRGLLNRAKVYNLDGPDAAVRTGF